MTTRYRAEQVGSLLRPPDVLEARAARGQGRLTLDQLRRVEDRAIEAALQQQHRVGMDVCTDGEMRRGSWLTDMAEAVEGFVPDRVSLEWKGPGGGVEGSTALVAGARLRKIRNLTGDELPLLKKSALLPYKITLPAPSNFLIASYKPGVTDAVYETRAELLNDLVQIVRQEVQWLVSQGVPYIQFDAPYYSHYLDPSQREQVKGTGLDPDRELENAIAGDNAALVGIPREHVTLGLHVCRGNSRSRIDEAARYVPLENLALSPQCGFASVAAGNLLSIDDQWRKLELVVDTARQVWGQP